MIVHKNLILNQSAETMHLFYLNVTSCVKLCRQMAAAVISRYCHHFTNRNRVTASSSASLMFGVPLGDKTADGDILTTFSHVHRFRLMRLILWCHIAADLSSSHFRHMTAVDWLPPSHLRHPTSSISLPSSDFRHLTFVIRRPLTDCRQHILMRSRLVFPAGSLLLFLWILVI